MAPALDSFHPAVTAWFRANLGEPTPPQREGWPLIAAGGHVLIAAPTGHGKTLAAFLYALQNLFRDGAALRDQTRIVYISPLRALSNDVRKNLLFPLDGIRAIDPALPEIRVLTRTGDTPASERARMIKKAPHVLVTTPESLYILLTTARGRTMLQNVRTVIVDELHAVARDKRGSHLLLSLERLEHLVTEAGGEAPQRIGLSATQRPIERMARFLVGPDRECAVVDSGHRRPMDLAIETPALPLDAVCSHDQWDQIYQRIAQLSAEHKSTLVFVNTRKQAERLAARLGDQLGADQVTCHHGSLARERRLDAEQRLKEGRLRILVATASLELGIDIGDVNLAIQVGASRSIATFLQRMGRAGHTIREIPKGRVFPLTIDELVEAAATVEAVRSGLLDAINIREQPLDILGQQIVAECTTGVWEESQLFHVFRKAWPYRNLSWESFQSVCNLYTIGRSALLVRDHADGTIRATKKARLRAVTSGGAIADTGEYQVILDPAGTIVGSVHEDFAIETSRGEIFQLGTASWQVLKLEPGRLRVADAHGAPPTLPFWLGEAPARTKELAGCISSLREKIVGQSAAGAVEWLQRACSMDAAAAQELVDDITTGARELGALPTTRCMIAERFFDDTGGMQLILHASFGARVNRALGYALRKRICRSFGFELQAAANDDAVLLSLGPQTSFPLEEIFSYLHPASVRDLLIQAVLPAPFFTTRWRWNVSRALLIDRFRGGRTTPIALQRMFANDLLVKAFPAVMACGETLPPGDLPVPGDHPIVTETIRDCIEEFLDVDGLIEILQNMRAGTLQTVAVDTHQPSRFARGILSVGPYAFLDDAPLEERRTQAVSMQRSILSENARFLAEPDPQIVAAVCAQAWPRPASADELQECLAWMGYITLDEAPQFAPWLEQCLQSGRAITVGKRIFNAGATRDPLECLRGRLCARGPVHCDDPEIANARGDIAALEAGGFLLRIQIDGREAVCERGLLARIHQGTLEKLRRDIAPVTAAEFIQFLARWQRFAPGTQLTGPRGVADVLAQLAGIEAPAIQWERGILHSRIQNYKREWLDQSLLAGEIAWARLYQFGAPPARSIPISFFARGDMELWCSLGPDPDESALSGDARAVLDVLRRRGALFAKDLSVEARLLPTPFEAAVVELAGHGFLTTDTFAALRFFFTAPARRRQDYQSIGRLSLVARRHRDPDARTMEFLARLLLRRNGVVCRTIVERERLPVPWYAFVKIYRTLEARGEVRGGRFVAGYSGEQYALPESISTLRSMRRDGIFTSDSWHWILTHAQPFDPLGRQNAVGQVRPAAGAGDHLS